MNSTNYFFNKPRKSVYVIKPAHTNENDCLVPEIWVAEALMILQNNMIMANLVHRDFDEDISKFGDTVNAQRPRDFVMGRKHSGNDVTVQDADSDTVPVVLNQLPDVSFMIYDDEASMSLMNLVEWYLTPAMVAMAQGVDRIIMSQIYQFWGDGKATGKLSTAISNTTPLIDLKELMTTNKVPSNDRRLIIPPNMEGQLLKVDNFVQAQITDDMGLAMREGYLGRKFGFDIFTTQNAPSIAEGNTTEAGAINNGAGYVKGSTVLTVKTFTSPIADLLGGWCTIAGDMTPQKIIAGSDTLGACTEVTVWPGLQSAVIDSADITAYVPGAINLLAGYAANWSENLAIDGFSVAPKAGQLISIGEASTDKIYGALETPTTTEMLLDRPLEAAVLNADQVGLGPKGEYGFAFNKNALAFVNRPLASPNPGTGVRSYVANLNGFSVRVTMSYDGKKRGTLVVIDMLCGVKVLNENLGCLMFA